MEGGTSLLQDLSETNPFKIRKRISGIKNGLFIVCAGRPSFENIEIIMKNGTSSFLVLGFLIMFLPLNSAGQSSGQNGFDIEVDPIAYALNGFSVHGGYTTGSWRFDLGIFGLEFPDWAHDNKAFTSSFIGAGWKADRFLNGEPNGLFIGAEGGITRLEATHQASDTDRSRLNYSLGLRGGYRWNTGLGNVYVTPWLGLGFALNSKDITVDSDTYEAAVFQPFPTIHIGWKF